MNKNTIIMVAGLCLSVIIVGASSTEKVGDPSVPSLPERVGTSSQAAHVDGVPVVPAVDNDPWDIMAHHNASKPALLAKATLATATHKKAESKGIETNSAGFQLLRPQSSELSAARLHSSNARVHGKWSFWPGSGFDPTKQYPMWGGDTSALAEFSIQQLFVNSIVDGASVVSTGSTFAVDVTFNDTSIQTFQQLLLPLGTANSHYYDWFGIQRPLSVAATEMLAVLVTDSKAHVPFSITQIVAQELVGVPIRVSEGLTYGQALRMKNQIE